MRILAAVYNNVTMPPGEPLKPVRKIGPLFISTRFKDVKDPCICYDGTTWHIYGSGGDVRPEVWQILHATAPSIEGPWTEQDPVVLHGVEGPHVAAPSVVFDPEDHLYHMAVQKDFMDIGGGIEYLVSGNGSVFTKMRTLVEPRSSGTEAGLYDPHFAEIGKHKYLVYSGIPEQQPGDPRPFKPQPDVYLARSTTDRWSGFWRRVKVILTHEDIAWHHNRRENPNYEWGIEGPQILALPNGKVLLNATCFIEEGRFGTRQRVFFAVADSVEGPYQSIGPVLGGREDEWESGENGHASAIVCEDKVYLFYQARSQTNTDVMSNNWMYGIAVYEVADIMRALRREEAAAPEEA